MYTPSRLLEEESLSLHREYPVATTVAAVYLYANVCTVCGVEQNCLPANVGCEMRVPSAFGKRAEKSIMINATSLRDSFLSNISINFTQKTTYYL